MHGLDGNKLRQNREINNLASTLLSHIVYVCMTMDGVGCVQCFMYMHAILWRANYEYMGIGVWLWYICARNWNLWGRVSHGDVYSCNGAANWMCIGTRCSWAIQLKPISVTYVFVELTSSGCTRLRYWHVFIFGEFFFFFVNVCERGLHVRVPRISTKWKWMMFTVSTVYCY